MVSDIDMGNAFVYMLASRRDGALYVGVTSDLIQRVWQHKHSFVDSYAKKYNINNLVYFEQHLSIENAILREKQLKKWNRQWKIDLIESINPDWRDLYESLL